MWAVTVRENALAPRFAHVFASGFGEVAARVDAMSKRFIVPAFAHCCPEIFFGSPAGDTMLAPCSSRFRALL